MPRCPRLDQLVDRLVRLPFRGLGRRRSVARVLRHPKRLVRLGSLRVPRERRVLEVLGVVGAELLRLICEGGTRAISDACGEDDGGEAGVLRSNAG